jgi:hypothetical protein
MIHLDSRADTMSALVRRTIEIPRPPIIGAAGMGFIPGKLRELLAAGD